MTGRRGRGLALAGLVLAVAVAVAVVAVALVDDDRSEDATGPDTTTPATTGGTTTGVPGPGSSPATGRDGSTGTGSAPTAPLPVLTDDPQSYAERLLATWRRGDRQAAAEVASPEAVEEMFAEAHVPSVTWSFVRCAPAAGSLYCTWDASDGASMTMTVRTQTGGLPIRVEAVQRQR